MASNPFHDLYLSEAITEDALVELFSPVIVRHSGVVFEPGNVIIRGLQGTGKTMLLNLLRPDSRLAYTRAGLPFPVSGRASRFIGAGVNLRKCGVLEFAQHLERDMDSRRVQELALLFADFINYWIVADLIATIQKFISTKDKLLLSAVGLTMDSEKLNAFSIQFAKDPCWFGYLEGVGGGGDLTAMLEKRIAAYRRFLNLNVDELASEIRESKTVVGDPILKCVEYLKVCGVLEQDANVFIRIDQYEQLDTLNIAGTTYGSSCKELVHKALAARDGRVSYRVGTRTHGWDERPAIYRTNDVLERKRDYDIVDMDELFRRRENSRTWLFPEFAEDIFARRMRVSEYSSRGNSSDLSITGILGKSLPPASRAASYVPTEDGRQEVIRRAIAALPVEVTDNWRAYIAGLARSDLLSAWLSCAWIRQKMGVRGTGKLILDPPEAEFLPWREKPYWFKERVHLALMQIASANRQALLWSGTDDVMSLAGGEILVFLFLIQHIWDAWLRDNRRIDQSDLQFPIRFEVQSQGVLEASIEWRTKQAEGRNSQQRRTFIDALGEHFYVALTNDRSMSYPGANGFSVENTELDQNPEIKKFLREASSFGDLFEGPHTSKKKGERRTKYYLDPILSPYFRIPSVHTKEPQYVGVDQIRKWMDDVQSDKRSSNLSKVDRSQPSLWDEVTGD